MPHAPTRALRRRPAPTPFFYRTFVTRVDRITPHVARITFGGAGLATFQWDGPDQRVKVFLPQPETQLPDIHPDREWYARFKALPDDVRPVMRTYTLRGHDPERHEVQIDFVLHGDIGPASAWAARAAPGDEVGILGPYADYEPLPDAAWQLLIGDETALPAIGGILESLPAGTPAHAFVEVADPREERRFETSGEVTLTWIYRDGEAAGTSTKLAEAVRSARLPQTKPYVWMAAEANAVRTIRRHLVNERGIDRASIYFSGYWRYGTAEGEISPVEAQAID